MKHECPKCEIEMEIVEVVIGWTDPYADDGGKERTEEILLCPMCYEQFEFNQNE